MYKLSKRRAREFAQKMNQIDNFCETHKINQSTGSDSYFFKINNKAYVVSNRKKQIPDGTRFILASKIRIIEIYNNLLENKNLDYRGYEIKEEQINV